MPESCITPKFHFMVYYPAQIISLGPMVCSWTMCYESKLQFFKRASLLGNFKNIALTVAEHHKRWICYQLTGGDLLSPQFECGSAKTPTISLISLPESLIHSIKIALPTINDDTRVFNPK